MIADGVLIGSVDVGGLTADQATAAVEQAYFAPIAVRVGHYGVSVSPHRFWTALHLDPAVQAALDRSRGHERPAHADVRHAARRQVGAEAGRGRPIARRSTARCSCATTARSSHALTRAALCACSPTRMLIRDAIVERRRAR